MNMFKSLSKCIDWIGWDELILPVELNALYKMITRCVHKLIVFEHEQNDVMNGINQISHIRKIRFSKISWISVKFVYVSEMFSDANVMWEIFSIWFEVLNSLEIYVDFEDIICWHNSIL